MLDNYKRTAGQTRSYRNVVLDKNAEGKISWTHKVSNEDVLARAKRTLIETIRKRQLEFLGHLCRKKGKN